MAGPLDSEEDDESASSLGGMRARKYLVTRTDLPPVSATIGSICGDCKVVRILHSYPWDQVHLKVGP